MFLTSWSGMGPSTVDRDRKFLAVVLVLDIKTIFFENHNKWFAVACFGDVSPYVCSYYIRSVYVAEWPPFGKELLTRLTICSLSILTICNFSYFPLRTEFGLYSSSWLLHVYLLFLHSCFGPKYM